MNQNLRAFQQEAIDKIYSFFQSNTTKGKVLLSTGLGKTVIIRNSIEKILEKNPNISVLILTSRRMICEQFHSAFNEINIQVFNSFQEYDLKNPKIIITTYQSIISHSFIDLEKFNLIICDEAQFIKGEKYKNLFECNNTKYLGFLKENLPSEGWFSDASCIYSYSFLNAMADGYFYQYNENSIINEFINPLLSLHGYKNIQNEVKINANMGQNIRLDILAEKENSFFVFEIKLYRGSYNSPNILNMALDQIIRYKTLIENSEQKQKYSYVIIMFCNVEDSLKKTIYEKYSISIWDISNLIYLCDGSNELSDLLIRFTPYSILEIDKEKPYNMVTEKDSFDYKKITLTSQKFQNRLNMCKTGKTGSSDKTYEKICTDIVEYLFGTEFSQFSKQHKTDDEMFRMDLLCSLKGTTEFWKFLIRFYNTKFVVFEYKNYSDYISQNLIYITEKYLFPVALRNVAFIISRHGFDPNAEKAALGCLKENGKLVVSINDEELVRMIAIKENGEEPSDYLLNKVEQLLMSVSK
ncbi:hypothetical protein LXJ15735_37810 [Lacrimispora xylanolytica]